MNVELPETLVIIESVVYKSNGFAIDAFWLAHDAKTPFVYVITAYTLYGWY